MIYRHVSILANGLFSREPSCSVTCHSCNNPEGMSSFLDSIALGNMCVWVEEISK